MKQPSLPSFFSAGQKERTPQLPINVIVKLAPAKPTEVFRSYLFFACERQNVYFKRLAGVPPPWTDDPILRNYKFTNAYRASDRVSQYLLRHVLYDQKRQAPDVFFRCLLFKLFNKIETWEMIESKVGDIRADTFDQELFERILTDALRQGTPIYSAAYIMPSGSTWMRCDYKHQMHLTLLSKMMKDHVWEKLASSQSMGKAFEVLRSYPTIGDFLAYQYITDLNYSSLTGFSEMEFVVPGPGAKNGIRKCFESLGGLTEAEIIRYVADHQEFFFDRFGLSFQNLRGRRLQLIDCQNLFCEVDKYARVRHPEYSEKSGRARIKQIYRNPRSLPRPFYPPKWRLQV